MESHTAICLKWRDSVEAAANAPPGEKGVLPPCASLLPSGSLEVEDEAEMMEQKTVIGLRMAQGDVVWVKDVPDGGEGGSQVLDGTEDPFTADGDHRIDGEVEEVETKVQEREWRRPVESVAAWRVQLSAMSMEPEQLPFMEEKYLPGPHLAAVASIQAP